MSWSWSHTAEAYENARENLGRMAIAKLIIIAAEWHAYDDLVDCSRCSLEDEPIPNCHKCNGTGKVHSGSSSSGNLDDAKYKAELKRLRSEVKAGRIAKDSLIDSIWEKAEQLATCENGGHEAWMCPFGCGCHMVSFSTWKERMDEARRSKRALRVSLGISPCGTKLLNR